LVWRVTSGMLDRIGEKDLPWIAAERDMAAADRSGDDLLIAGAAWRLAVVLRHNGCLQESIDVPVATADALRPRLAQSPKHASMYGALMLKGAVGAATLGDHVAVRDYLRECDTPPRSSRSAWATRAGRVRRRAVAIHYRTCRTRISRMVSAADISNEAKQPNRFEKKKNICSLPCRGCCHRQWLP
jgi:hypothetical protein